MGHIFKRAFAKGRRHWVVVALVLAVTVPLTPWLGRQFNLESWQNWLFQKIAEATPRPIQPRTFRFVMVDDPSYTSLQSRIPMRRDYIAKVVRAAADAGATIIAIDFDLRIRHPGSPVASERDDADYNRETGELVNAIIDVARTHRIILPKLVEEHAGGTYVWGLDNYQRFGICKRLIGDGRWESPGPPNRPLDSHTQANINCGYIQLTKQRRMIPPSLPVGDGGRIDSFGLALARAWNPELAETIGVYPAYGTFLPADTLEQRALKAGRRRAGDFVITTTQLFRKDPDALDIISGKPVIIGARWHDPVHPDQYIDMHDTPSGERANGSLIHDSYAEAIVDGRTYSILPHWLQITTEILISVLAAVFMAGISRTEEEQKAAEAREAKPDYKGAFAKLAVFLGFAIALLAAQWLAMVGGGTVFDAIVPLFAVFLHSVFEKFVDRVFVGPAIDLWRRTLPPKPA